MMMPAMRNILVPVMGILLLISGCGAHQLVLDPGKPDLPVPPQEPRAEMRASVDLVASQGCEEKFDLALYQNRSIDLIQWDEQRGACAGRKVAIRYLSSKITANQVQSAASRLARRFTPETRGDRP